MKQVKISLLMLFTFTLITGFIYPLVITGIAGAAFQSKAEGSMMYKDGVLKGSVLIGQNFTGPRYFHGRPSAVNYDSGLSGGSNFGQVNEKFTDSVKERAAALRGNYNLDEKYIIPSDLLFASGSGLDPHISVESAEMQAERIAAARGIDLKIIRSLIELNSEKQLLFYGRLYVNVLKLNRALDEIRSIK